MKNGWIIGLAIFLTGLIATVVYIVIAKPQVKRTSSSNQADKGTNNGYTPPPADNPNTDAPGEDTPPNDMLETVTIQTEDPEVFDVYNFDKDINHFMPGDLIFSRVALNLEDINGQQVSVNAMQPIGIFITRDLRGITIENNGENYFIPGINADLSIMKLIEENE